MGLDWQPRVVASHLAEGYRRDGFWTGESLGSLLGGRLAARRGQTFTLRADGRPWSGTFGGGLDARRRGGGGPPRARVRARAGVALHTPHPVASGPPLSCARP